MPRQPKHADLMALRRLHDAAGSREELIRWIDAALGEEKQRRGPKAYSERFSLGTYQRISATRGARRTELIRQLVREDLRLRGRGTESSAVQRVSRKLRKLDDDLQTLMDNAFEHLRPLLFTDEELRNFTDLIRARIKSRQPVRGAEYNCPSVTQLDDGRFHDTSGNRAPSPPERARPSKSRRPSCA